MKWIEGVLDPTATLLQLVINDPWFAWLHPLSELVVRIDETIEPDSPATEGDGAGARGTGRAAPCARRAR